MDGLEFAKGDAQSKWGSVRAAMGHPEPFDLRYVAIGNEDCGKKNYRGKASFQIDAFWSRNSITFPFEVNAIFVPCDFALELKWIRGTSEQTPKSCLICDDIMSLASLFQVMEVSQGNIKSNCFSLQNYHVYSDFVSLRLVSKSNY